MDFLALNPQIDHDFSKSPISSIKALPNLTGIPKDVIQYIFLNLSPSDLNSLRLTCKIIKYTVDEDKFLDRMKQIVIRLIRKLDPPPSPLFKGLSESPRDIVMDYKIRPLGSGLYLHSPAKSLDKPGKEGYQAAVNALKRKKAALENPLGMKK